jgi:hypothetical protein
MIGTAEAAGEAAARATVFLTTFTALAAARVREPVVTAFFTTVFSLAMLILTMNAIQGHGIVPN